MFHCRKIAYFMFTHDPLPFYRQSIWLTRQIAVKTVAAVPNGRGCISGVSSSAGVQRRMMQRTTCFACVGGSSTLYCSRPRPVSMFSCSQALATSASALFACSAAPRSGELLLGQGGGMERRFARIGGTSKFNLPRGGASRQGVGLRC